MLRVGVGEVGVVWAWGWGGEVPDILGVGCLGLCPSVGGK